MRQRRTSERLARLEERRYSRLLYKEAVRASVIFNVPVDALLEKYHEITAELESLPPDERERRLDEGRRLVEEYEQRRGGV